MTLEDLQRHYDTYYSPNNATLVVVGDIKADSLLPTIKQLFEPIPRGPEPKPIATMEPEQKGERRFLLKRDAQVPFVMIGYRVPNFTSEDSYALDILDSILSHGKSARLYQSLVYEQKSSLAVGSEYSLLQADPGLFYFYALVSPGQKPEVGRGRPSSRDQTSPDRSANRARTATGKEPGRSHPCLRTGFQLPACHAARTS